MTRWARSGNTQKHRKMPGDSTPWEGFSKNEEGNSNRGFGSNKIRNGRVEKKKHQLGKNTGFVNAKQVNEERSTFPENKKWAKNPRSKQNSLNEIEMNESIVHIPSDDVNMSYSDQVLDDVTRPNAKRNKKFLKKHGGNVEEIGINVNAEVKMSKAKAKKAMSEAQLKQEKKIKLQELSLKNTNQVKKGKRQNSHDGIEINEFVNDIPSDDANRSSSEEMSDEVTGQDDKRNGKVWKKQDGNIGEKEVNTTVTMDAESKTGNTAEEKVMSRGQLKRARKRMRWQESRLNNAESSNSPGKGSTSNPNSEEISSDDKSPSAKDFLGGKKLFLEKLQRKGQESFLPSKTERRLYNIKKELHKRGMRPESIQQIISKKRKAEDVKFRKSCITLPCFNCRETGHLLSECPLILENTNQETGICFKCGSRKHTAYKCHKKVQGYPLAKCFVCKEQGHISKDCPKNEHGIYPKGGKCNLCGNVNHFRKDCPTLNKKKTEILVTLHTIKEGASIDAEILDETTGPTDKVKKSKQSKIVKF